MNDAKRLVLGLALIALCAAGHAAGPRTHAEMGQRAWDDYLLDMEEFLPGLRELRADDDAMRAFYCGCTFPDFGYNGIYDDAAEYAHWYDFQQGHLAFVIERFPPPWDAEARKHIAFFLGTLCHGVGDVPWHFDEWGRRSLLSEAKRFDDADHGTCEIVTDVFSHVRFPLAPPMAGRFWWPQEEMIEVFRRQGFEVTPDQMARGCRSQENDWNRGATLGRLAYFHFRAKYPWSFKHYETYHYGGVDNGAAYSAVCMAHYYARLHGRRYYQNILIQQSAFPKNEPFLPCLDAHLIEDLPGNATGGEPFLEVGNRGAGTERRALIRFDIGDMPADTPLKRATLWLRLADHTVAVPGGKRIEAVPVLTPWQAGAALSDDVQGADGLPAAAGDATWASAPETAGNTPALSSSALVPGDGTGVWKGWDVTEAARAWRDAPDSNHGVMLRETRDSRAQPGMLRFYSSDAFRVRADGYGGGRRIAWRPILLIE